MERWQRCAGRGRRRIRRTKTPGGLPGDPAIRFGMSVGRYDAAGANDEIQYLIVTARM